MKSPVHGRPRPTRFKAMLIGLLLTFVVAISGCASSSPTPRSPQSQVRVDPSLMVEPSYTQTLLDFLSDKPSEPTPK